MAKNVYSLTNPSVRIDTIPGSPAAAAVTYTLVVASTVTGPSPAANTITEEANDTVSVYAVT